MIKTIFYFILVSAHTFIVAALPNKVLGTSAISDITLVPANASTPGLRKLVCVLPTISLKRARSKKNGSSLEPANILMPFALAPIAAVAP